MVEVKRVLEWTIPYFGNCHIMPYGKLLVSDGITEKVCSTKGDKETDTDGYQYITFNRKRYEVIPTRKGVGLTLVEKSK